MSDHPDIRNASDLAGAGWIISDRNTTGTADTQIARLTAPSMGTWRVHLRVSGTAKAVFGQRRNLVSTQAREEYTFLSCLTEYIPSMSREVQKEATLFASVHGARITSFTFEQAQARRIFIAGDSTVADQFAPLPWHPFDSYAGWGQMLPCFLPEDAVCNQAHSGMTSRCFVQDGHMDIILSHMQKGDLLLIQFGHNDQKRRALAPNGGYTEALWHICTLCREKGGIPVLISPPSRVPFRDALGWHDLLLDHAQAVRALAEREHIPFIDLHEYTFRRYISAPDMCREYFKHGDATHGNDHGAYINAAFVAKCLQELGLADPVFSQSEPDFAQDRTLQPPPSGPARPLPVPYADITPDMDRDLLSRAVNKGLLDPCVAFMHPQDPLPEAQFIVLLFRRARIASKPTDGIAPTGDVGPYEWDSSYAMACRDLGFLEDGLYHPDRPVTHRRANELCRLAGLEERFDDSPRPATRYEIIKALV